MAIEYRIVYHSKVVRGDIPRIGEPWRSKIKKAIEEKLTTEPDLYSIPLRRSLKGYRKLRVGDYRIVLRIENKIVKIVVIMHRSIVYEEAEKRAK